MSTSFSCVWPCRCRVPPPRSDGLHGAPRGGSSLGRVSCDSVSPTGAAGVEAGMAMGRAAVLTVRSEHCAHGSHTSVSLVNWVLQAGESPISTHVSPFSIRHSMSTLQGGGLSLSPSCF